MAYYKQQVSTMVNTLAFFSGIGTQEILIVGAVVLVLFGGAKIPELMRGLGKGVSEFKNGIEESKQSLKQALEDEPSQPRA